MDFTTNTEELPVHKRELLQRLQSLKAHLSEGDTVRLNGWIRYGTPTQLGDAEEQIGNIQAAARLQALAKASGAFTAAVRVMPLKDVELFGCRLSVFADTSKLNQLKLLVDRVKNQEADMAYSNRTRYDPYTYDRRYDYGWGSRQEPTVVRTPEVDPATLDAVRSAPSRGGKRKKGSGRKSQPAKPLNYNF
jgi:hypothetical protein